MKHSISAIQKRSRAALTVTCALTLALTSCMSLPDIPADATDREIIQMAQNAYDSGNSRAAEYCYLTLTRRYGTNINDYIVGRFELAHLYLKKKKYEKALPILQELKELYENTAPGQLPAAYGKMVSLDWEKIPAAKRTAFVEAKQKADDEAYEAEQAAYYAELEEIQDELDSWDSEDEGDSDASAEEAPAAGSADAGREAPADYDDAGAASGTEAGAAE